MANKYFKAILTFAFILVWHTVLGQENGDGPPGPPGLPIDGGIIGLLLLGAGYASKKIYDKSKD